MTRSHRVPFLLLLLGLSSVAAAPGWATAGNPLEVATRPIFERNVGQGSALKISRGLNALWSKGGIQYGPPVR